MGLLLLGLFFIFHAFATGTAISNSELHLEDKRFQSQIDRLDPKF